MVEERTMPKGTDFRIEVSQFTEIIKIIYKGELLDHMHLTSDLDMWKEVCVDGVTYDLNVWFDGRCWSSALYSEDHLADYEQIRDVEVMDRTLLPKSADLKRLKSIEHIADLIADRVVDRISFLLEKKESKE